jgi:hypothetical protein
MVTRLEEPAALLSDHYPAVAPFIGIGLVVASTAVSRGVQGDGIERCTGKPNIDFVPAISRCARFRAFRIT